MTHEQHAKKFIKKMYFKTFGCIGPEQEKEIDEFFRHLKEAVKKEIPKPDRCLCEPDI